MILIPINVFTNVDVMPFEFFSSLRLFLSLAFRFDHHHRIQKGQQRDLINRRFDLYRTLFLEIL